MVFDSGLLVLSSCCEFPGPGVGSRQMDDCGLSICLFITVVVCSHAEDDGDVSSAILVLALSCFSLQYFH